MGRIVSCIRPYSAYLTALAALVWFAGAAWPQSSRGTITGTVLDGTGAAVPGASVAAVNTATSVGYRTSTNETGNYSLQQLPEGRYEITVEQRGFKAFVNKNVELNVAQTLTLNVQLELGEMTQSVEVTSSAAQVQSATSELGTVINRQNVMDLPLSVSGNMRNIESFVFLTPGVTGDATNTQINGSQSRGKEVLLDGIGATSPESGGVLWSYPSVEAISEFTLLGSNFAAEYGRTGGGFEVFTTKSGTNAFHGALFDYLRNNVFDARGFFARTTPVNRQNEYGGALGGPVRIPKLYNGTNRTFFYFVYSGFRYRQAASNNLVSIPPPEFRQGDFSRLVDSSGKPIVLYDPATTQAAGGTVTRTPFPGNRIPQSRFSTVSQKILPLLPTATSSALLNNFLALGATTVDRDQVDVKIDHNFSDRNRINGFVYVGKFPTTSPNVLPVPLSSSLTDGYRSRWVRLGHDFIVSPTKMNHLGVGFTREGQYWSSSAADQGWPDKIGLTGVNTGPGNTFPRVTFTDGYTNWGDTNGTKSVGMQVNNALQITDSFSWVHGSHSLKFGADARWLQTNGADFFGNQGSFAFSNRETGLPGAAGVSGNGFASFLLGVVDSTNRNILAVVPGNRYRYFAGYAQDDWKITRRLTLNYGLRYEIYFPRSEAHQNLSAFDPAVPNPAAGGRLGAITFLGSGPGRSGKTSFADTYYKNFGPRLAFAYALNDKTAVHAGYGIYYAPGNATAGLRGSQKYSFGFNASPAYSSTDSGVTPALQWDSGFPTNFARPPFINPSVANGTNVNWMAPGDGRPPYFQNWTVDVQRELPGSMVLDAAYVGIKGTRLGTNLISINQLDPQYLSLGSLLNLSINSPQARAANIPFPYPGFNGSVAQALRPYPQYLDILDQASPNGNSTYHALQVKAQKRFSHGLTFLAAYTWSKSLSDSDIQAGGGPAGQTYYNRRLEKAISDNDVPQILALSYLYELPFGPGKALLSHGRVVGKIAGGWTLTGIQQYSAGKPVVLSANNTLPLFNGVLRPDAVGGVPRTTDHANFDPNRDLYINRAAFQVPQPFLVGTAARSYTDLRAFPFLNESFGLIKRMPVTENVTLTFRAEFFNAFNRVVFGAPAANVSAQNFGRVSSQANSPRQGQVALRLDF